MSQAKLTLLYTMFSTAARALAVCLASAKVKKALFKNALLLSLENINLDLMHLAPQFVQISSKNVLNSSSGSKKLTTD